MNEKNIYLVSVPYDTIDIYRIARLYEVRDNELFHALKKVLYAGKRGSKTKEQDVKEAILALTRWLELNNEEIRMDPQPDSTAGGEPDSTTSFTTNGNAPDLFDQLEEKERD